MDWFEKIDRYYKKGMYTDEQVRIFVQTGKITEAEYTKITGKPFNETPVTKTRKSK